MTHTTYHPYRYNHPRRVPHGPIVDYNRPLSTVADPAPPGWNCCVARPRVVIGFPGGTAMVACRACASTVPPSRRFVLLLKVTDAVREHWAREATVSHARHIAREHYELHTPDLTNYSYTD